MERGHVVTDADPAMRALAGIRDDNIDTYADGSTSDIPRLVAALEAVLKLADGWNALWPCTAQVREAITAALTGEESS